MIRKVVSVGAVERERERERESYSLSHRKKVKLRNGILKSTKKFYEIIGYIVKNKGHPLII